MTSIAVGRDRRSWIALVAIAVAVAGFFAINASRSEAATNCPGTFRVMHNDHIGTAAFPKGNYQIVILTSNPSFTCSLASTKFTKFLQDYDGILGGGWTVSSLGSGKANFLKNGGRKFGVRKQSGPTPGPTPGPSPIGQVCPGVFEVLNNDRIGPLSFPKGNYKLIIPNGSIVTCKSAAGYFKQFLSIPSGNLPDGWRMKRDTATFFKKVNPVRKKFRVDPM